MASWEDEDFDPDVKVFKASDKWDGEDADDNDVKDDWEDEEEEKVEAKPVVVEKKKKIPLAEKIRLKEEAKKEKMKQMAEAGADRKEDNFEDMTPEEQAAEKLRRQKLVEEADLLIAAETFGVTPDVIPGQKTIDNMNPSSKEEFNEFQRLLTEKITKYETKPEYVVLLESLFRDCCAGLDPDDIKRISTTLNVLATEKVKVLKGGKTKKKTTKKALAGGSAKTKKEDYASYGDQFDDFDDFI